MNTNVGHHVETLQQLKRKNKTLTSTVRTALPELRQRVEEVHAGHSRMSPDTEMSVDPSNKLGLLDANSVGDCW